ncbi:MAG: flagellar assembly protein FliH [Gemmatimonadales bacterium]|nr:flagellar assembly protein FliH [Gemmatimonadales bacterium]
MQKWSLEEFTDENAIQPVPDKRWDQESPAGKSFEDKTSPELKFQRESGFSDPDSLLNNLTQEERKVLFDLVEQDLVREFKDREETLKAEQEKHLLQTQSDYESKLAAWAAEFGKTISTQTNVNLLEIGKASALLAVQLAGKITRTLVPLDPDILVRGMETTLSKVSGSQPIRIVVHPDDASWLQGQPDFLQQLRIGEVSSDRRIERGGCLLQSAGREWDATLAGQLEALGEVVNEAMATSVSETTSAQPEDGNEAGLE